MCLAGTAGLGAFVVVQPKRQFHWRKHAFQQPDWQLDYRSV
jgi:hypothetical protein